MCDVKLVFHFISYQLEMPPSMSDPALLDVEVLNLYVTLSSSACRSPWQTPFPYSCFSPFTVRSWWVYKHHWTPMSKGGFCAKYLGAWKPFTCRDWSGLIISERRLPTWWFDMKLLRERIRPEFMINALYRHSVTISEVDDTVESSLN